MGFLDSGYARINGAKLYYEIAGEGEPIVLVHGFTLDNRMWDSQFKEFSEHYKVIRYDVRGFGKSSTPVEGELYSNHEDLKRLLDYFKVKQVHIIGLSIGGGIAINFTLEYPAYVLSLVSVDASLDGFKFSSSFFKWYTSLFRIAKENSVEEAMQAFMNGPLIKGTIQNPSVMDKLRNLTNSYSGWRLLHKDPQTSPVPSPINRINEIKCPTLVIVGEHDISDFHRIADKIHEEAPNSRKAVIPSVGHMCNMEDPEAFNKEILLFLDSLK
jgi:pimeloyl-ACP methyl ester carboxylesterase